MVLYLYNSMMLFLFDFIGTWGEGSCWMLALFCYDILIKIIFLQLFGWPFYYDIMIYILAFSLFFFFLSTHSAQIPDWLGREPIGSTKYNPFPLPDDYMESQQRNVHALDHLTPAKKFDFSCWLGTQFLLAFKLIVCFLLRKTIQRR